MDIEKKGLNWLLVLVYLFLAVYFLDYPFKSINIPESWSIAEPWIIFAGGILLLLGVINYFRLKRKPLI